MKRAVVLQHVAFEGPARIASMLADAGCAIDVRRVDRGDPFPERLSSDDVLVVMGGPMGVADLERGEHPFLAREVQLLARCIRDDSAVLGVCLGAQLLACAAGARVRPMVGTDGQRCYEVGWTPMRFHHAGEADPILRGLPPEGPMLSWHGDAFELPAGARLLASTAVCPNQAFALGSRQFGLQFHPELGAENVEELLRADGAFVERANGAGGVERLRLDMERNLAPSRVLGDRLLANILGAMLSG